ncbi:MAG: twin-arginine translocase TatA/TatE family subunit [Thermodesulfobacteriota bacterium]|nr:twin-arginine translocase TatA/TatE family subunit [Thermodesulfobacteriota bacterium]
MFGLGGTEIIVIAVIILLIFGAKRLPDIGSGLGQTVREIGKIKKDLTKDKKSQEKTEENNESEPEKGSIEGKVIDSIQDKVSDKVLGQIPGVKQAKDIKAKADKIKKIVS